MAENDYREYKKEEEGNVSTNAVAGRVNRANVVVGRRLVAVSYTHLDVYKRQTLSCSERCCNCAMC